MHGRKGFTLTELLLVIAITALLAALLFPVLLSARKQARMSRCTSNLRQIGVAQSLYVADYGAYPDPIRLTRSVTTRKLLFCPEDPDPGDTASSYTFRSLLPHSLKPYWETGDVEANTVLVVCNNHLEQPVGTRGATRTVGAPRYPWKLALRADGRVERIHVSRVREQVVPGDKPVFVRVYPGETGYERAMR